MNDPTQISPFSWSYLRCDACPHKQRQIKPTGPPNAEVFIISDSIGKWDEKDNRCLSGQAGKELDYTYLSLANLRRHQVFTTTVTQCRHLKDDDDCKPPASTNAICSANHIPEEILTVNPKYLILLGAQACELAGISKLEFEHGFPRYMANVPALGYWSGWVVPMYSPGAGMKDSKFMIPQLEDWERFGKFISGDWMPPILNVSSLNSKPDYFLGETAEDVRAYFNKYITHVWNWLAIDSESDEGKDWSIQISLFPGTGLMVRLSDSDALLELVRQVNMAVDTNVAWSKTLVFHHADADVGLCEHIGIAPTLLKRTQYHDTMQELFALGNLPQGLKAAVYRTLGKRMRSYDDVVTPWSKNALANWLSEAYNYVETNMQTAIPHPPGPNCPTCNKRHIKDITRYKPHESAAVIKRVLNKITDGVSTDYNPWEKSKTTGVGETKQRLLGRPWLSNLETQIGRMPRASIVHVPISEAKDYGCSDADHTGMLAEYLMHERDRIVTQEWKTVQQQNVNELRD